jgi:hypothetical protein
MGWLLTFWVGMGLGSGAEYVRSVEADQSRGVRGESGGCELRDGGG